MIGIAALPHWRVKYTLTYIQIQYTQTLQTKNKQYTIQKEATYKNHLLK